MGAVNRIKKETERDNERDRAGIKINREKSKWSRKKIGNMKER